MNIDEKKTEEVGKETYAEPVLTKHDALHALTGASGVVGTNCQTNAALCN